MAGGWGCEGNAGAGGGWYGGTASQVTGGNSNDSGAGGSGYIGNPLLKNKYMVGYNVETSDEENTKTLTTTNVSETPTSDYAKSGNGHARITNMNDVFDNYTQIEYIESTGTQYIDTNFVANGGMIAEYLAEYVSNQNSNIIVGSCSINEPYGRNYGSYVFSNNQWELGYGDYWPGSATTVYINQKYKVKFSTIIGNAYMYLDDIKIVEDSQNTTISNTNVMIFNNQYDINRNSNTARAKIYYCKIWDSNNNLVRNFIPCIRKADGKPGLYDTVGMQFYTNQGSGEFETP